MLSASKISDKSWKTLHEQYSCCKLELKHYKFLYKNESVLNKSLKTDYSSLKQVNESITNELHCIKTKYLAMRQPIEPRPLSRKRKA